MTTTITALNPKYQGRVNRIVALDAKYNEYNRLRDCADGEGNDKVFRRYDSLCANTFDRFLTLLDELPKREQNNITKKLN